MSAVTKTSPGFAVTAALVDPLLCTPDAIKLQAILDEVCPSIQTSEKIIPKKLIPFMPAASFPNYFKQFGGRFLKYLKHNEFTLRVREAVKRAAAKLDSINDAMQHVAVCRFNVGECQEIASLIRVKDHLAGVKMIFHITTSNEEGKPEHCFLMNGKNLNEDFEKGFERKEHVLDLLKTLKRGTIIDGLLHNKVFAAKDLMHCKEFVDYFKTRKITQLSSIAKTQLTPEQITEGLKKVDLLYALACKILPEIPPQIPEIHAAILENEPGFCADLLKDKIPNTKWSKNATKQKVWLEGTEEKAKEIAEYLNAHGIKATVASTAKSTHLAMIDNPDFNLIEKLPPFEQWLKEKASTEKEATQAAPEKDKKEAVAGTSKKKKKKKTKS